MCECYNAHVVLGKNLSGGLDICNYKSSRLFAEVIVECCRVQLLSMFSDLKGYSLILASAFFFFDTNS